MEAQTFPFDRGKCERRADREQHPLRTLGRASPPWRSSVGFFRLYVHFVTLASPAVRLECIRRFDDTHSATPYLAPPHPPLPIPTPTVQRHPAAHTAAPPFGDLRLSDVCPKLKTLTGNAVRSTFMNEAWVCGGDYDGAEHSDSSCGVFWDYKPAHSLVPPPPHSSWPACAAASPFGDLRSPKSAQSSKR